MAQTSEEFNAFNLAEWAEWLARAAEGDGDDGALDMLVSAREAERALGGLRDGLVARAREEGATWEAIGEALGVSRQAVQKRWGSRAGETA